MNVALASLAGLLIFLWPFLGLGPVGPVPALAVAGGTVLGLGLVELGTRRLDSRRLALLAALAAIDSALRLALVSGIGGFSPVFFPILCAGYALGPSFGFLTGATSLFLSALVTGGVGPWLPYQVFAAGWVGLAAGVAGRSSRSVWVLALVGCLAGYGFGVAMDTWDWTFFAGSPGVGWEPGLAPLTSLHRFAAFYLLTSAAYDTFRAVGNVALVLLFAPALLAALRRIRSRFTVEVIPLAEREVSPLTS